MSMPSSRSTKELLCGRKETGTRVDTSTSARDGSSTRTTCAPKPALASSTAAAPPWPRSSARTRSSRCARSSAYACGTCTCALPAATARATVSCCDAISVRNRAGSRIASRRIEMPPVLPPLPPPPRVRACGSSRDGCGCVLRSQGMSRSRHSSRCVSTSGWRLRQRNGPSGSSPFRASVTSIPSRRMVPSCPPTQPRRSAPTHSARASSSSAPSVRALLPPPTRHTNAPASPPAPVGAAAASRARAKSSSAANCKDAHSESKAADTCASRGATQSAEAAVASPDRTPSALASAFTPVVIGVVSSSRVRRASVRSRATGTALSASDALARAARPSRESVSRPSSTRARASSSASASDHSGGSSSRWRRSAPCTLGAACAQCSAAPDAPSRTTRQKACTPRGSAAASAPCPLTGTAPAAGESSSFTKHSKRPLDDQARAQP
mmetsp:Transcript_5168/g.12350  ORF Transcript_5168/g.12350 Transcript_5168/m.12350 type:complete len:440 (+) Transcript_5168:832-2151(+)